MPTDLKIKDPHEEEDDDDQEARVHAHPQDRPAPQDEEDQEDEAHCAQHFFILYKQHKYFHASPFTQARS